MRALERIIFPLDVSDVCKALELVNVLSQRVGMFKVGFESIYANMKALLTQPEHDAMNTLRRIRRLAMLIQNKAFIDCKLADIPNTVGAAALAISDMGPQMFNVHASAGAKAIGAAAKNKGKSRLYGVTVLTSIDAVECVSIFGGDANTKVAQFAGMLLDNGADGIICAPKEGLMLRKHSKFNSLLIATPNIRPEWYTDADDQNVARQMTAKQAFDSGIDQFVIGRPISRYPKEKGGPARAAELIIQEIEGSKQ